MPKETKFDTLLSPLNIGKVKLKNRIIKTASGTMLLSADGIITDHHKAYYEAIAKGGLGLINVEDCTVDFPRGAHNPPFQLRLDDDIYIPSYTDLTDAIHKHNCATFLQLMHSGAWDLIHEHPELAVSSSAIPQSELPGPHFNTPRSLSVSEINELVDKFASAAVRAQKAGFDGVEVNSSTCHLVNSFLSRFWNRRQDVYGYESLENRSRFAREIVQEIKHRTGKDFPVIFLFNAAEFGIQNGTTLDEGRGFARIMQQAGADALHVRAHGYGQYFAMLRPEQLYNPEPPKNMAKELDWSHRGAGATVPLAAAIKKVVSIPVITVGRLDPVLGEKVLRAGKADFIGMTRRLLADPELPKKIAAGRMKDIAPCTACLCCTTEVAHNRRVRCRINAPLGGERKYYQIQKAPKKKKVVVVGGGPGGMEAARVAAIRGHQVILYDRERKLGGLLALAAMIKGTDIEDLPSIVKYFERQLANLKVDVRLGREFTAETARELKPDVLILATGGRQVIPDIPGMDRPIVVSGYALHHKVKPLLRIFGPQMLRWLTRLWMPIGKNIIVIGGQLQGCELAELFVKRGRKVTIVESMETVGSGLSIDKNIRLFEWLARKGVPVLSGVKYEGITDDGLNIITREGQRKTLKADTIVPAMTLAPDTELYKEMQDKAPEVYVVGDCKDAAGLIMYAVFSGYHTAYNI